MGKPKRTRDEDFFDLVSFCANKNNGKRIVRGNEKPKSHRIRDEKNEQQKNGVSLNYSNIFSISAFDLYFYDAQKLYFVSFLFNFNNFPLFF